MRPLIGRGLSAAVYTQTTDVEIEVNGLMTYDREVVKMDRRGSTRRPESFTRRRRRSSVVVAVPAKSRHRHGITRRRSPTPTGLNRTSTTANGRPGRPASAPRGRPAPSCARSGTRPTSGCAATFELEDRPPRRADCALIIHHDDDAEVYLNGTLVKAFKRHTNNYQLALLDEDARRLLKAGNNTIAVHCHQTDGGQYIDAGLVEIVERDTCLPASA